MDSREESHLRVFVTEISQYNASTITLSSDYAIYPETQRPPLSYNPQSAFTPRSLPASNKLGLLGLPWSGRTFALSLDDTDDDVVMYALEEHFPVVGDFTLFTCCSEGSDEGFDCGWGEGGG